MFGVQQYELAVILLRALPPEVEAKLWKQVPHWPKGLQAKVFAAASWRTRQNHPFATGVLRFCAARIAFHGVRLGLAHDSFKPVS
jgi:hypothetical protein